MNRRRLWAVGCRLSAVGCGLWALACTSPDASVIQLPANSGPQGARKELPPVAINADIPVDYPAALYNQGIEGRVLLKLWADSTGTLDRDSSKIAESSGYPAFDSAAMVASTRLRYAPGMRNGVPVAMSFTQPIEFRHSQRTAVTP